MLTWQVASYHVRRLSPLCPRMSQLSQQICTQNPKPLHSSCKSPSPLPPGPPSPLPSPVSPSLGSSILHTCALKVAFLCCCGPQIASVVSSQAQRRQLEYWQAAKNPVHDCNENLIAVRSLSRSLDLGRI